MTTETTISNLLTQLKSLSSSYQTKATDLVRKADQDLSALNTPLLDAATYTTDTIWTLPPRTPSLLDLGQIDSLTLPAATDLQDVDQTVDIFTGTPPFLRLPTIESLPSLTAPTMGSMGFGSGGVPPSVTALTLQPTVPVITEPSPPSLTAPQKVTANPVSGTAPEMPLPAFTAFTGNVHDEYLAGIGLMQGDLTAWSTWINRLRGQLLPIEAQLQTRLRNTLAGVEAGLTDTWETQTYEQEQQVVFGERYDALTNLEVSSITGLPSGDSVYPQLQIELKTLQALMQAAAKTTNARQSREVEHLKWATGLLAGMANAAIEIKAQEALWRMKGWELALNGAELTLDTALKVVAFKERELDFWVRYNDAQVRRLETQVAMEKTKLESVQLDIENNKLQVVHSGHQVQAYQVAAKAIENRINLYQSQIEYLAVDVAWRKLALQAFEAEINAYQSEARAKSTEYQILKAKITRDEKQIEAKWAEVRLYEAEVLAESAQAQSLVNKANAQIAYRNGLVKQYNASVQANTAYLNAFDDYTQTVLEGLDKQFSLDASEKELLLADEELRKQAEMELAEQALEYEALKLSIELKNHQVALNRAKAESEVLAKGANVLGGISTTAFSGLNAVAVTAFEESM
jgi:hypothetical protein